MPPSETVGPLLREKPYVRVITPFFYWPSSKGAKGANIPAPSAGGTLVGCARPRESALLVSQVGSLEDLR
jgi:hypothetical protein